MGRGEEMLHERIKEEREKKNLSQSDLGKTIGVSQQTIGSWEVGRTSPDHELLSKLADFFAVTVDYLLGREVVTKDHPDPEIAKLLRDHGIKKLQLMANYTVDDVKRLVELGELLRNKKQGT